MKSKFTFLIALIGFVLLIAVAALLYNRLGRDYTAETLVAEPTPTATAAPEAQDDSEATAESGSEEDNRTAAPDFTVTDGEGDLVSLSQLTGEVPVVLNFWTSKCGPCRTEMPHFEQAHQRYGDQVRFVMVDAVGFMGESEQSGRDYVEEQGYTLPVYYDLDQSATLTYGIRAFPTTFFLDAEGNLVAYAESMLTEDALNTGLEMLVPGLTEGE